MFRGALVPVIFNRILTLQDGVYNESKAVSLMGMDTERICLSIEVLHETWAQLIEVILGSALLGRQLGWVCVFPLLVVAGTFDSAQCVWQGLISFSIYLGQFESCPIHAESSEDMG